MPKREINAKDLVSSIKAGMTDVDLMRAYRLTPKGLDSALRKLATLGLISLLELEALRSGQEETVDLSGIHTALAEQDGNRRLPSKKNRYLYSGKVEGIDILDYIQWMLIEGRQTVLEVSPLNGIPYRLFIDGGKVLHAVSEEMEGEDAFYRCVQATRGEFTHLTWSSPKKITIRKEGMQLLLEAARRRDEADAVLQVLI